MVGYAFADGYTCQMVPGGALDNFEADFYNQAQRFATNVLPTVTKIYWFLFGIWVLYEMSFDKILGWNIDRLYLWWIARIFVAYLIEHIFLDPTFYVGIIQFGAMLGSKMGGFSIDPNSSAPLGVFTPSAIMSVNKCVAYAIKNANVGVLNILASLELWTIQFGFLIISGIAAFYVMYLSIKIWIALFVGFINAMFAGNSWTVNWWQQYLATVMRYAMELVIVSAMLGVIFNQLMAFVAQLTAANADIIDNYGTYLITLGEMGFMTFLMFTLPQEISRSMGGSFGGKLTDFTSRLIMTAGGWGNLSGGGNGGNTYTPPEAQNGGLGTGNNVSAKDVFGGRGAVTATPSPTDWQHTSVPNSGKPTHGEPMHGGSVPGQQNALSGSKAQWGDAVHQLKQPNKPAE